jgi:2,4-dienoyl-CoA reductase-like NADH-dependent reductase (Old Yellow Enzyme family)
MIITGNVQVDDRYLGTSADLSVDASLPDEQIVRAWTEWAAACQSHGTPAMMQLNHPGRQCPIGAGKHGLLDKNVAPSAVGLDMGPGLIPAVVSKLAFGVPQQMSQADIDGIVEKVRPRSKAG